MLGTKAAGAREGDKMSGVPIEKYGLRPAHAIHLEGITYWEESVDEYVSRSFDYSSMYAADEKEIVRKNTAKSRKLATERTWEKK